MGQIETMNLNFYYGQVHALKNVNISMDDKTVTAFIGPSGCGKSTLLRLFNRMNDLIPGHKTEGKVMVNGQDIYGAKVNVEQLREKVGMVFQKPNPFPKSIFDNVSFGLRVNGGKTKQEIEEKVTQSLTHAALWDEVKDKLNKSALELSGGQQQRLCIARALAVSPSILLMDEPASALDPISTSKIEELISKLKSELTIIIVTHSMQQAKRVSDKTAFFYLGELVEYDVTDQIFSNPKQERTLNYVNGKFG